MLSKYAHKMYLKKDLYAVFNNLLLEPLFVNTEEMKKIFSNNIDSFSETEKKQLYDKCIYIHNKEQDKVALKTIRNMIESHTRNKITMMYIIPNNNCNLKCKYCFLGQLNEQPKYMSEETAYNAIIKFVEHLKKINADKGQIIFYGAEPLINFDIIKYITLLVEKLKFPIDVIMVSNATLLDEEKMNFIKEHNVSLGISIDGTKEINDENRIFKGDNSSVYDIVMKKLKELDDKGIPYGLSITISEETLDNLKVFKKWLKDNNFKDINYNPLQYSNKNSNWKKYYNRIGKEIFNLNQELFPLGVNEDRISRKYKSFYNRDFKYSDCGAVGANQICISPNGDINICHGYWNKQEQVLGNINNMSFNEIFKTDMYNLWHNNLTINKKKCINCPAIFTCGGGCGMEAQDLFGKVTDIDLPFCKYTKDVQRRMLLDLYECEEKENQVN